MLTSLTYVVLAVLAITSIYLSCFISYHTIRSDSYDRAQKFWIVGLSWLVPVIWPVICIRFLAEDETARRKPGIPLLEFIFLSGVLSSSTSQGSTEISHDAPTDHSSGADSSDT